ncbi:MAG: alcohol dehydrogenase catalytic domain-containing protein [Thaumarchaeota archaeon]|nr:alcohol dehydrogenase catalytic domain-containing protein [Nitrososphaerota archaeon]
MISKAAVLRNFSKPLEIEEVELLEPDSDEVIVKIAASGVCRTDLSVASGHFGNVPLPLVPGHEAAGTVYEAGTNVSALKKGDHVLAVWIYSCNNCEYCLSGHLNLCKNGNTSLLNATLPSGKIKIKDKAGYPVHHGSGTALHSDHAILHQRNLVKIPDTVPLDKASVVGCAVMTGVGAAINTAQVKPGSTVAVVGVGGVGVNVVQGAKIAGAEKIIVLDRYDSKLEGAFKFGATHSIKTDGDPKAKLLSIVSEGVDYSFEATGNHHNMELAYSLIKPGGTTVIVGAESPTATISIPALDFVGSQKTIKGSWYGSTNPRYDAARYINLYTAGKLLLDELISAKYEPGQINEVFSDMESGKIIRGILVH